MDNKNFIPPFSILSLAAILVGIRDHRTHFWKGAIQESFQQNFVDIGSVVSEEKIFFLLLYFKPECAQIWTV
jgi:phosphotransferase system  glucose/maltose/N-acetylglucosamine-specific IIC component